MMRQALCAVLASWVVAQAAASGSPASAGPPWAPAQESSGCPSGPVLQPSPGTVAGITIPAGTVVTVMMIDSVDSSRNHAGEQFAASVDDNVVVGDNVPIHKGANAWVRLIDAESSGKIRGRARLELELVALMSKATCYNVESSSYEQHGGSRGKQSAKRIGGLGALGAAIGAVAGGGLGAAIGAAAGAGTGAGVQVLTHGEKIRIPSETRIDFTLKNPVVIAAEQQSQPPGPPVAPTQPLVAASPPTGNGQNPISNPVDAPPTALNQASQQQVASGQIAPSTRQPETTGDETIVSDLNAKLWQDESLESLDIRVSSQNGVVTLTGMVKAELQKVAVERLAGAEQGVKQIIDLLGVAPPASSPTPGGTNQAENPAAQGGAPAITITGGMPATDIRRVDFQNFDYLTDCGTETRVRVIHVSKGEWRGASGDPMAGYFVIASVAYADLKGDGQEEAVVHTACNNGANFDIDEILVFVMSSGRARLLAKLTGDDWGGGQITEFQVRGKQLVISFPEGGFHAQPDWIVTARLQWNGSRFARVASDRKKFTGWP